MKDISQIPLPAEALLGRYATGANYTDCFVHDTPAAVTLNGFVAAFYTTWLFKAERLVLTVAAHPSTDLQAAEVASGHRDTFAAWKVEAREAAQILLCDASGRTRSWFMVAPRPDGRPGTRLHFGSAIVAVPGGRTGALSIGPVFRALTSAHVLYSRALLRAAAARLGRDATPAESRA